MSEQVLEEALPDSASTSQVQDSASSETVVQEVVNKEGEAQVSKEAAPIEYGDFELPSDLPVDQERYTAYLDKAKELGLSKEQAQGLMTFGAEYTRTMLANNAAHIQKVSDEWAKAAKTDKEFGGAEFENNMAIASKAVDAFATPELKELLNTTGLGNHPDMIRVFYQVGKLINEDKFVSVTDKGGEKTLAERLFPNLK